MVMISVLLIQRLMRCYRARRLSTDDDSTDHAYLGTESQPFIWGQGVLGDSSTLETPIVLKHFDTSTPA